MAQQNNGYFISGQSALMRRVASMPVITGIETSMITTSGRSSRTASRASAPLAASPTISMSGSARNNMRKPDLTISWSSTSNNFVFAVF